MARLPYVPAEQIADLPIFEAISARRKDKLLNLDLMLLHSPEFTEGWQALFVAIRGKCSLSPALRELVMCAIAVLNRAPYEWDQHIESWRRLGASDGQVEAIGRLGEPDFATGAFSPAENAVLALTVAMTREIAVPDPVFEAVSHHLASHKEVVELVGLIAAYNMVSRILVALEIDREGAGLLDVDA